MWVVDSSSSRGSSQLASLIVVPGLTENIFWQPSGAVTIGPTAHFEGVTLSKTLIALQTGASANGRLLAQTAVTLDQNAVTQPAP